MALVVGTDSYISVAEADDYWLERNNSTWASASAADKEKALRQATQYIDGAYEFIGTQKTDNILAWPRFDVYIRQGNFRGVSYDSETIPPQVKSSSAELALDALSESLTPTLERGGAIKKEKVDVIEVEYMNFAPSTKTFQTATMLLKPLIINAGFSVNLSRT